MPTDRLRAALEACKVPCLRCISTYRSEPCPVCGCNGTTIGRTLPPAVAELLEAVLSAVLEDEEWNDGWDCGVVRADPIRTLKEQLT